MPDTKACTKCNTDKPVTDFYRDRSKKDGFRTHCKPCERPVALKYRAANAETMNRKGREDYALNPESRKAQQRAYRQTPKGRAIHNAKANARRVAKIQRTPAWADRDAIKGLYEEAARLQEVLGIEMHCDHIVPLQGELVCGLHVESNLQVIPAVLNLRKSNKFKVQ